MPTFLKTSLLCILGLAILGGVYSKGPQIHLLAKTATAHLNYAPLPVLDFTPGSFVEQTTAIRLGSLKLDVPLTAVSSNHSSDDLDYFTVRSIRFQYAAVTMLASAPRCTDFVSYKDLLDPQDAAYAQDEVALIAEAYSADANRASLWMGRADADRMRQLLDIRAALPRCVERVEIVRNAGLKGLLFQTSVEGGKTIMAFDYYSEDEGLTGNALLIVDEKSKDGMAMARALVASFRLPPNLAKSVGL